MIGFNVPPYIGTEMKYIEEAVAKNHKICGDGPFTKRCNAWLEKKTGTAKALLTTSCTHATEMAALLADIKEGDEIIMPSYTFVSTADAFVLRGAVPVFVDIRPDTMNIDEKLIEAAITEKTRAIVPVHYAGVACEMDKIMEIAYKHNLKVVEDAAQGVMSTYKGKALGTIGDFGCYSFHETKNYSMGEGAYRFVDMLREAGQTLWEVLPHGQTGYCNSPYKTLSAFAGNPYFIAPDMLEKDGLLLPGEAEQYDFGANSADIDYGRLFAARFKLLRLAFDRFCARGGKSDSGFLAFRRKNAVWLSDYALFMALKEHFGWKPWNEWEEGAAFRRPEVLRGYRR